MQTYPAPSGSHSALELHLVTAYATDAKPAIAIYFILVLINKL